MDRYFSCSSFYAFFLPEKESVGKKSRHKGGLRRDSLRSYSAQFPPLCIPPYDCSADSESICLYPKRSASIKPPVSKKEYHVWRFSFSRFQSVYTLNCNWDKRLNSIWLKVCTFHTAVTSKSAVFPLSAVRALLSAYQFRTFSAGGIISKIKTFHALTQI